jgi:hypothetical protein
VLRMLVAFGISDCLHPIYSMASFLLRYDAYITPDCQQHSPSVLEAANSDLASLINRLDLEATPDSKASRPMSFAITDPTTSSRMILGDPRSPVLVPRVVVSTTSR